MKCYKMPAADENIKDLFNHGAISLFDDNIEHQKKKIHFVIKRYICPKNE